MHAIAANRKRVAIVVYDGLAMFEFGVACEVFGTGHSAEVGVPWYELVVAGARTSVTTDAGLSLRVSEGLTGLRDAGTIVVPPCADPGALPRAVPEALRAAHARGTRLVSLCTGAFVLAAAGLLDGRPATTHWTECELLRATYPSVAVDPSVLYVDDGDILTSAGSAASLDLCLHVVAEDHGSEVANRLARQLVVTPHRQGGQAQYIDTPLAAADAIDRFAETIAWARAHLAEPISIDGLAARCAMSSRTFARRFAATTGTTPYRWLTAERLRRAQRLLETTELPIELVALDSGFADATTLRKHFGRELHTSPSAYRTSFRATPALASEP